jgi:hypothetical protein
MTGQGPDAGRDSAEREGEAAWAFGLKLTYQPARNLVVVTADPGIARLV